MRLEKLTRAMLPAGFAFGLFVSQQAFVLTAPDNGIVGQGTFEEASDSVAQIKITMQGREYTGTGIVREIAHPSTLSIQRQGMRSDRAFSKSMGMRKSRQAKTFMASADGAKLACDLTISANEVVGQCINPDNQQMLTIKSASGELQ
jgi:hypothetical protein